LSLKNYYSLHKKIILGTSSLIVVILLWEVVGQLGIVTPLFFAWPSSIVHELINIFSNGKWIDHFSVSLWELVCGYGLASLTAIPLGLIMGRSQTVEYIFDPLFSILYAMPRIALMPLIILIFGIGLNSKIVLVYIGCFFPILLNVFQGTKSLNPLLIDMAKVFGAKNVELYQKIFLPAIMPYMVAGFRVALSIGLIMVVVGEFQAARQGIGYMIAFEAGFWNTSGVMAWVSIISALAIFGTQIIKYFERRYMYWR
jgi:NitT/TauT family transport system permease protein